MQTRLLPLSGLLATLLAAGMIRADDTTLQNPADAHKKPEAHAPAYEEKRMRSWELPPVTVTGKVFTLREEERVGSYGQPRWTARRLFGETRTYVIPEGQIEYEFWFISTSPRHGPTTVKTQHEIEIGLPHRFQVDLYEFSEKEGNEGTRSTGQKFEVRYALANWGEIWGNPALYTEWEQNDAAPDHFENKLLLTGEFSPRWHWGGNLVYEHETGGDLTNSYEVTGGITRTFKDEVFALGLESKFALEDNNDLRGRWDSLGYFDKEWLLGPTLQFRPLPQMHINLAALFGMTLESPAFKPTLVMGWEF